MITEDDVLEHFGVKGMRWGVRRSPAALKKAAGSVDYRSAKAIRDKGKKSGVKSLTNKQLETASKRLSAEQRYSQLVSQQGRLTRGHNVVKAVLAIGGTASAAYGLATSPAAKAGAGFLIKNIKNLKP